MDRSFPACGVFIMLYNFMCEVFGLRLQQDASYQKSQLVQINAMIMPMNTVHHDCLIPEPF